MRPTRVLRYVSPDAWEGEEVVAQRYSLAEDRTVLGLRLVGIETWPDDHRLFTDMRGLTSVAGIFADAADGCRVHLPAHDRGRSLGPFEDDLRPNGHVWLHKWPLTPFEELQTPWFSTYGHAPGEGHGMNHTVVLPFLTRVDDVFCLIGRFETYRAGRILAALEADAPSDVAAFLRWLTGPGLRAHHEEALRAQWVTGGVPSVLWCCSPADLAALRRAVAAVLTEELRAELARDRQPANGEAEYRHHPRRRLAEHLKDVTERGDAGRYLAAAAFLSLGPEGVVSCRCALARTSHLALPPDGPSDADLPVGNPASPRLLEGLGLTDEDRRQFARIREALALA